MSELEEIYLCRHGQTAWSKSGQHTSYTDLELIPEGIEQAKALSHLLKGIQFDTVLSSPLKRATQTAEICGYSYMLEDALFEWNYGEYEGLTTEEIRKKVPGWDIFDHPCPGGETFEQIEERVQGLFSRLLKLKGRVLLFSSGHISRCIGPAWIGLPIGYGKHFDLSTASLSILGFHRGDRVISTWNSVSHIA